MRVWLAIFLALAGPALAEGEYTPMPGVECYCTDSVGARVEMGETICLSVGGRNFLARCEMSLNVPMWRDIGSDCLGAGLLRGLEPSAHMPDVPGRG
ncbi:MAG: hypothetical protein KDK10_02325 [Maritimibacter sp.]|nr:hypothetical protein [Maritimibacter sp.]